MKKRLRYLKTLVLVISITFCTGTANAQIAGGPFTIGTNVSNDYQTIQEAIDSLESLGVSGHVVFNLVDATYI